MSELREPPTPTQDLAALARVAELLNRHGSAEDGTLRELNVLREEIEEAYQRHCDLAEAFNAVRPALGDETLPALGLAIIRAAVAVGAQIVFPSPDSAETPERAAEARTAPGIDTVSVTVPHCKKNPGCCAPDGHSGVCWVMTNASVSELTGREKILAEVAESMTHTCVPLRAAPGAVVNAAIDRIKPLFDTGGGKRADLRDRLIGAADLLVFAVERLDDADE